MSLTAAVIAKLVAAGLSNAELVAACRRIEASAPQVADPANWIDLAKAEGRRRRKAGEPTNPRAMGINPRALGTNPRAKP